MVLVMFFQVKACYIDPFSMRVYIMCMKMQLSL